MSSHAVIIYGHIKDENGNIKITETVRLIGGETFYLSNEE